MNTDTTAKMKVIRLHLARNKDFPEGSVHHGYQFVAPLDPAGHIDVAAWRNLRSQCRVKKFWNGEESPVGLLMHKPGGAEHARWVFDNNPADTSDDEAGYRFGSHTFAPGEYVSVSGADGSSHTFVVATVEPLSD